MKRSIVLLSTVLMTAAITWARDPRWPGSLDNPNYNAPEPAAIVEIALLGTGLGIWALRRKRTR